MSETNPAVQNGGAAVSDSTVSMISAVSVDTFNNTVYNAGVLMHDVDISSATDAASLLTLITNTENRAKWFGATQGGVNIQENRTYWTPDIDGLRLPFKGQNQVDTAEPKMTGTLVELTAENVKAVSGAADKTTDNSKPNITTVQPRASIKAGDYYDTVMFVGNQGSDGLFVCIMQNALCTSGINSQTGDKAVGTLPFEFTAHSASATFTDTLPIKYLFFKKASA